MTEKCPEIPSSEQLAAFLKAAADDLRLQILRLLAQDSYGVMELAQVFEMKQSGMSHHLKLLAQAQLVATRREGNSIFYRRALVGQDAWASLRSALFQQVDKILLGSECEQRLAEVRNQRIASSQTFFNDNADRFASQQDLIASYPVYAEQTLELLLQCLSNERLLAVEIGPGQGEFLPQLSSSFERVVAVDISQTMLAKAEQAVATAQLNNVQLQLLDGGQLVNVPALKQANLVVANMVLHHVPSPAQFFQQAGSILAPGGSFLVTDLCLHDQNWAREACGDVWLGFDPDDLTDWAVNAGFSAGQSLYFALRNGFQIQIRQFIQPVA